MNKLIIGKGLKSELAKGYDIVRISRWAFNVFSEDTRSLAPSLQDTLENLFAMEDDPQFELSEEELHALADKLIAEGEKEELGEPLSEIKEIATEIAENWLMCPLCQEAWETQSTYGMVRCPACNHKLHNPKYKPA
jgi:hypothetical protein